MKSIYNSRNLRSVEFKNDGTWNTNAFLETDNNFGNYTLSTDGKLLTTQTHPKEGAIGSTGTSEIKSLTSSELIFYNETEVGGTSYYDDGTVVNTITGIEKTTITFRKILPLLSPGM